MPKEDKFERVLNKKDVFVLAFGAMIGWGWVVLSVDIKSWNGWSNDSFCTWWIDGFICWINLC